MGEYERPAILATFSVDELVGEAATCQTYVPDKPTTSDRDLKERIEEIDRALEGVKSIRTP